MVISSAKDLRDSNLLNRLVVCSLEPITELFLSRLWMGLVVLTKAELFSICKTLPRRHFVVLAIAIVV